MNQPALHVCNPTQLCIDCSQMECFYKNKHARFGLKQADAEKLKGCERMSPCLERNLHTYMFQSEIKIYTVSYANTICVTSRFNLFNIMELFDMYEKLTKMVYQELITVPKCMTYLLHKRALKATSKIHTGHRYL